MLRLDASPQYPRPLPDAVPYAPPGASPCILRRVLRLVLRVFVLRLVPRRYRITCMTFRQLLLRC